MKEISRWKVDSNKTDKSRPIRVDIKLRNNCLVSLRESVGLSPAELAEKMGVGYSDYLRYEGMAQSPIRKRDGDWTRTAKKISAYWQTLPEDLFPDVIQRIKKTRGSFAVDEEQIKQLGATTRNTAPVLPEEKMEEVVEARNLRENLQAIFARQTTWYEIEIRRLRALEEIISRERMMKSIKVYERRIDFIKRDAEMFLFHYGFIDGDTEHTYAETAERYGITATRVMDIMNKWLRRLRHGGRKELIEGDPERFAEAFGYIHTH